MFSLHSCQLVLCLGDKVSIVACAAFLALLASAVFLVTPVSGFAVSASAVVFASVVVVVDISSFFWLLRFF